MRLRNFLKQALPNDNDLSRRRRYQRRNVGEMWRSGGVPGQQ
jgi:hypothetical protein